jgi:hypothetical protein
MGNRYVEQRDGGYYVPGSRVSLDSVVYAFLRGESPDSIVDRFRPSVWNRRRPSHITWRTGERSILTSNKGGLNSLGCAKSLAENILPFVQSWTRLAARR